MAPWQLPAYGRLRRPACSRNSSACSRSSSQALISSTRSAIWSVSENSRCTAVVCPTTACFSTACFCTLTDMLAGRGAVAKEVHRPGDDLEGLERTAPEGTGAACTHRWGRAPPVAGMPCIPYVSLVSSFGHTDVQQSCDCWSGLLCQTGQPDQHPQAASPGPSQAMQCGLCHTNISLPKGYRMSDKARGNFACRSGERRLDLPAPPACSTLQSALAQRCMAATDQIRCCRRCRRAKIRTIFRQLRKTACSGRCLKQQCRHQKLSTQSLVRNATGS